MTTIGLNYDVIPGKEPDFEAGARGVMDALASHPGHVETHIYQDIADRSSYIIMSQWETREAFQTFLASDAFKRTVSWGKQQILRTRPRHKIYQNMELD